MEDKFDTVVQDSIDKILLSKGIVRANTNLVQLGRALTEFYVKDIGSYIYEIYEDDIEDGLLCDGKGDLNIDFAYKNEKNILIIQSKYKGSKNNVTTDEISGFFNIHNRIVDHEYFQRHANSAIKDIIGKITPDHTFTYVFITNDKSSQRIHEEFDRLKAVEENKLENVTYEFKPFTELKKEYKQVVSQTQSIEGDIDINIERIFDSISQTQKPAYLDLTSLIGSENNYQSIICTIKGTSLKSLWDEHKARLFSYNIRGYLGQNPINKKIEGTLHHEPENFYFYNNGISAICTKIQPIFNGGELNKLRCSNFQIINGAQTTSTVARFKDLNKLQRVRILLKITKAEDYKKERGLNKNIITYNNSQSVIKAADFRSNDEIQIFLENKLSEFKYKGVKPFKDVKYQRKRLKIEKRKEFLYINMETLARVLYAFEHDPILIFKGTKYLFDTDENNGKYWLIFGDDNKEVEFFDERRLNQIVGQYFIWTKLEELLKTKAKSLKNENKEDTVEYQALLAKWHFLWSYGYILNKFHGGETNAVYKKLANGKLFEKDQTFIERWFARIHNYIAKSIESQYASDNSDEVQGFNLKNWLRNSSDFDKLKREFKYSVKEDFAIEVKDN